MIKKFEYSKELAEALSNVFEKAFLEMGDRVADLPWFVSSVGRTRPDQSQEELDD